MRGMSIEQRLCRLEIWGVGCKLGSLYVISISSKMLTDGITDNLRFTLTSCLFGYPQQVVNMSSPCVVSCQDLDSALEYDVTTPSTLNFNTWCSASSFADNVIDQCEFCYNLTTNQIFMANCSSHFPFLTLRVQTPTNKKPTQSSRPSASTATSALQPGPPSQSARDEYSRRNFSPQQTLRQRQHQNQVASRTSLS